MPARVLVVTPPGPDLHDTGRGHPERPARFGAAMRGIEDAHLDDDVELHHGRAADPDEVRLAHDDAYVRALEEFAKAGGGSLDPDTVVAPGSYDAALQAAGCGLTAVDALRAGHADAAFVIARPPGHHATARRGQGFCLLNNVAIAAARLAAAGERVLVLDWDVHHGNGTQDIFWDDPNVLYVSTHEYPAYPGTGKASETGGFGAPGLTVNFPLPAGATGDVALRRARRRRRPRGRALRAHLGVDLGRLRRAPRRSARRPDVDRGRLRRAHPSGRDLRPRHRARGHLPRGGLRPRRAADVRHRDGVRAGR
ncbi:MAG: histone deacetylase [Acidimicrobiia bacterium]